MAAGGPRTPTCAVPATPAEGECGNLPQCPPAPSPPPSSSTAANNPADRQPLRDGVPAPTTRQAGQLGGVRLRVPKRRQDEPQEEETARAPRPADATAAAALAGLEKVRELRGQMKQLKKVKTDVFVTSRSVERKRGLAESYRDEVRLLKDERDKALERLQVIETDLAAATAMEEKMNCEHKELSARLIQLRDFTYNPLKDRVDELRAAHGLRRLPSLQEEIESEVTRYLDERRRSAGMSIVDGRPQPAPSSTAPSGRGARDGRKPQGRRGRKGLSSRR